MIKVRFTFGNAPTTNKRLHRAFLRQQKRCYFCRKECVLPNDRADEKALAKRERRDARPMATVEHLYPRGHKLRQKHYRMACAPCNHKHGNPALDLILDAA